MDLPTPKIGVVALLDFLGVSTLDIAGCQEFFERRQRVLDVLESCKEEICKHGGRQITIRTFGDSILLTWAKGEAHFQDILVFGEILKKVFHTCIWEQILIRGAVSAGEFIESDRNNDLTVLGPAIADVASWYEKADWSGIIATPRAGHLLDFCVRSCLSEKNFDVPLIERTFVQYDVPLKGSCRRFWCVAWPEFLSNLKLLDEQRVTAFYARVAKFTSIPFGTETKYSNTLTFFEWYWKEVYPKVKDIVPPKPESDK